MGAIAYAIHVPKEKATYHASRENRKKKARDVGSKPFSFFSKKKETRHPKKEYERKMKENGGKSCRGYSQNT